MALLDVKTRQEYLKYLGFYNGLCNGNEGPLTKEAYLKLQKKYFKRKVKGKYVDVDGVYGKNTNILLINAYLVKKYTKNFKLEEFRCGCIKKGKNYCTGYPEVLDKYLLIYLQELRDKYGSITITSGLRCKLYNNSLDGSSSTSAHMDGKAFDIKKLITFSTLAKRKKVMKEFIKKTKASYTYCKGYYMSKSSEGYKKGSTMGTSIHIEVK